MRILYCFVTLYSLAHWLLSQDDILKVSSLSFSRSFFLLKVISKYQSAQPKKTISLHYQLIPASPGFLKSDFSKILHNKHFNFFNPHVISSQQIWTHRFIKIKGKWKTHWNKNSLIVKSKPTKYAYLSKVVWEKWQAKEGRLEGWMVPKL